MYRIVNEKADKYFYQLFLNFYKITYWIIWKKWYNRNFGNSLECVVIFKIIL